LSTSKPIKKIPHTMEVYRKKTAMIIPQRKTPIEYTEVNRPFI